MVKINGQCQRMLAGFGQNLVYGGVKLGRLPCATLLRTQGDLCRRGDA